jgi:hypothetical protein
MESYHNHMQKRGLGIKAAHDAILYDPMKSKSRQMDKKEKLNAPIGSILKLWDG